MQHWGSEVGGLGDADASRVNRDVAIKQTTAGATDANSEGADSIGITSPKWVLGAAVESWGSRRVSHRGT